MNKMKIFVFDPLDFLKHYSNSGSKYFLQQWRVSVYKHFELLYCGHLGVTPIPYVQMAIFNLPHAYLITMRVKEF